jgi:LysM repeat protein
MEATIMIVGDSGIQRASTTPPPPPSHTDGTVIHAVKSGETVGELSARYGVSEKQILAVNPQLRDPDDLSEGQEIGIPVMDNGGKVPSQVQVRAGDTLTGIAASHGVSVTSLANANGIAHPNQLRAGTALWIPVKGVPAAGVATSANSFQPQISSVDSAVKHYQAAHNGPQHQAASAALTEAVEKELGARATAGLPQGQSPSDSQLASYGTAIASRYAGDPGITHAIRQGVSNEGAAIRTSDAQKQVRSAQQALQLAGPHASQKAMDQLNQNLSSAQDRLLSQVEQEVETRAGLAPGQLPSAPQLRTFAAAITQRYASDPAATKAVKSALQTAPADIDAQKIVAQASSAAGPAKALGALNQGYTHASSQVQRRILVQAGTATILKNAAAQETQPLKALEHSNDILQMDSALGQSLGNLDKSAAQLDPTLAAGLVNQALPALNQFNSQYAKQFGGAGIGSDPLHAGPTSIATVMDLSGHIAGTPQGDQDIAQLAKIGFWNNGMVFSALYGGASAAYPEAMARRAISLGQDPTNVVSMIQQGVQADQQRVQGDVKALGQQNEALSWLIQNLGPSMSPQQLQTAVTKYESQNGWSQKSNQLAQKVVADATRLQQNMNSLSGLAHADPKVAANLNVQGTISSVLNDKVTSYGLSLAAGQNPGLYADSNGQAFLNLVSGLKLADQGRKTAQLIGSLYVRSMITKQLNGVNWNGANPLGEAQDVINSLKSPALSNWMGVNDQTVWNSAVKTVSEHLVEPGDNAATKEAKLGDMNQALNRLKALSASSPAGQLLRSVAVAYAFASAVNDAQKFQAAESAPDKTLAGLETFTAAAGLLQKGANLANGFGLITGNGTSSKIMSAFARDTANGAISLVSGSLDLVEGIRSLGGLGVTKDTGNGVFTTMSGVGGLAYGASQFAEIQIGENGIFDGIGASFGVAGGTFAAGLGLVGVGIVAAGVLGSAIYQQNQQDHQYEGASKDFLQSGGYSPAAASALSHEGGLLSGAGGVSGMPFLAKYAAMEHLSASQLQQWVGSLTPSQLHTLDQCLLQTAGDSNGDPANFTNGPEQKAVIPDYSGGFPVIVPLNNTLGVFQNNLRSSGVPLPP